MNSRIILSIIIVHYHVPKELLACIESIYKYPPSLPFEIIVIDNDEKPALRDELYRTYPLVRYVHGHGNVGYGAGNNIGARHSSGKYLFFLNPDTLVEQNAFTYLLDFMLNKDCDVVAPILLDAGGKVYPLQGARKLNPLTGIFVMSFINKIYPGNPVSKYYWIKGWDKTKSREVDVVPGTAFMIKKEIFYKVGMFDEKFFLYFEENDLCNRVKMSKGKIYMLPKAKIIHFWGRSVTNVYGNNQLFKESRFYYFRKYYGFWTAVIINMFLNFNKNIFLLLVILLGALCLRFFNIEDTFIFSGEVGHNLLAIKDTYQTGQIPLLGPPTSHPWLYFGPLFYWIYGPILFASNFDPLSHAYFGASISILTVIINYFVIKALVNYRTALISTFLMSVSPLFLDFGRNGRFFSIVSLLSLPFVYFLYKVEFKKTYNLFVAGLVLGTMFSFHFTPLMLIPLILIVTYRKKMLKKIPLFILGMAIPMLPFFFHDLRHDLAMTKNIILWIPYRIAGFIGLYPKNTISVKVVTENAMSFYDFVTASFIFNISKSLQVLVFMSFLCFLIYSIYLVFKKRENTDFLKILLLWLLTGYIALFIHGSPPIHYFVPVLPVPILIVSCVIDRIKLIKFQAACLGIFLFLLLINSIYLFSSTWYFPDNSRMNYKPYYMPYDLQQKIARAIVKDAQGRRYTLRRIGIDDQFEGYYAQNYIYLLWLYGNEPVKKANLSYTIVELLDKPYLKEINSKNAIQIANVYVISHHSYQK